MPSYITDKIQPVCQPALLTPQTEIFTNQTAMTYKIESIALVKDTDIPLNTNVLSSLEYQNNILEDCKVNSIDIETESNDRLANQDRFSAYGSVVRTHVSCNIFTPRGIVGINLTQEYDYIPESVSLRYRGKFLGSGYLSRSKVNKAALWWGESLMSWYWVAISNHMGRVSAKDSCRLNTTIHKSVISFTLSSTTNDPANLDFFDIDWNYLKENGHMKHPDPDGNATTISQLSEQQACPNIWIFADSLAKSTYFSVLTDLGQWSANDENTRMMRRHSPTESNILLNLTLLEYFSKNISNFNKPYFIENVLPGPASVPFQRNDSRFEDQVFNASASTISGSYLCQVPKLKSAGNIIVSILVADLVFLQVFWTIFTFVVDTWFLEARNRQLEIPSPVYDKHSDCLRKAPAFESSSSLPLTQDDEESCLTEGRSTCDQSGGRQDVPLNDMEPSHDSQVVQVDR